MKWMAGAARVKITIHGGLVILRCILQACTGDPGQSVEPACGAYIRNRENEF
jgi:hypothetical protein